MLIYSKRIDENCTYTIYNINIKIVNNVEKGKKNLKIAYTKGVYYEKIKSCYGGLRKNRRNV